jgi:AGCS family alanine or glycine:cation symporter
MAIVNLIPITLLRKWAFGAFTDYQGQEAAGRDPIFVAGAVGP